MNELPKFLKPEEVAAVFGGVVSVRTIQRLARQKKIPGAQYVGRRLFFQRNAVLAWIEGGATADVIALRRAG